MLEKLTLLFVLLLSFGISNAQITYYQDTFKGSFSMVGASSGDATNSITLPTGFHDNTSLDKIYLVCYGGKGFHFTPTKRVFGINGQYFQLDTLQKDIFLIGNTTPIPYPADYNGHVTYVVDLTPYISTIDSLVFIDWSLAPMPPDLCPGCNISSPILFMVHKDNTLPTVNAALVINDQKNAFEIELVSNNLNLPDYNHPIALGIHSDRPGWSPKDGYSFKINNIDAGSIEQHDSLTMAYGAVGCFHYSNSSVTGLTDDNPDSIFSGPHTSPVRADGLATINSYISNNQINPLHFKFKYMLSSGQDNFFISYSLAYSTPCSPIDVTVTKDTTICAGQSLQLNTTGGQRYEWRSATTTNNYLSCTDCANPIFSGDTTTIYTVRIWSTDNCSVVRPVQVTVLPKLTQPNVVAYDAKCSAPQSGIITIEPNIEANKYYAIAENGDTLVSEEPNFNNLSAGNYTVFYANENDCISEDTVVTINLANDLVAVFSVIPSTGVTPLNVQVVNTSENATIFNWYLNGDSLGENPPTIFDTAGTYQLELIASNGIYECIDSITQTVFVYDSVIVNLPNVFTPNNDDVNDFFSITVNHEVNVRLSVLNRWGNVVFTWEGVLKTGVNDIWDGTTKGIFQKQQTTDGTYFYKLEILDDIPVNEKVSNGFVEVRR